jgi:hypothetical protein
MAYQVHGAFNGYVPQATGQLISFMRDSKKWRLNDYIQYVHSTKPVGLYKRLGLDQPVRVVNDEINVWADGHKRPRRPDNRLKFETVDFQCIRRTEGFEIGWQAIEHADEKILTMHADMAMNQLMTARTKRVITMLETASNWGGYTATVQSLNRGAGSWRDASADPNSTHYLAIKKTLNAAALQIQLNTNGVVKATEKGVLRLLISPNVASMISETGEIHDYIKGSPAAKENITSGLNSTYNLPDTLYGWEVVVEDAPIVTQNPNDSESWGSEAATTGNAPARRYIKNDNSVVAMTRVGGLDGQYGSQSFTTAQIFYVDKELSIKTFDDPKHELTEGFVDEYVVEKLVAPQSGLLITGVS